jgi:hypothetical protein
MQRKNIKKIIGISFSILLISFLFSACSSSKKTTRLNSVEIRNIIDSSRFVFIAERVTPLRGSSRYLTSRYDVIIKKDSVNCYLPFFGRAFQAPIDPTKGGIHFVSTDFTYNVNRENEDEWQIIMKPKDVSDVQQLLFNIFDNGNATLNVVNTHRDPISFSGHIERIKD